MNVFKSALLGSTAVLLAVAAVPSANANLLINPGFSATVATPALIGTSAEYVTGWTDSSVEDFDLVVGPGQGNTIGGGFALTVPSGFAAPVAGTNYIAMDGDPAFSPSGISQTVAGLVAGDQYTVSFYFGSTQEVNRDTTTTEQIIASIDGTVFDTPVLTTPGNGYNPFQLESFTFTYNGGPDVLTFLASGGPTGEPPYSLIADPSLTSLTSVPEPASATLLLSGMAGLGWVRRRRARKT